MALAIVPDKSLNPIHIRLPSPQTVVFQPDLPAYLIELAGRWRKQRINL
jgi:hypothetical protein